VIRVTVWDIEGGERHQVVADVESIQMTDTTLRDDNDKTLLYLDDIVTKWVVPKDGTQWSDFTVEAINRKP